MTSTSDKIKVLIVDDSARYRSTLRNVLEKSDQLTVIGEAVNGIEALELILRLKPDVILMDLEMPLMDGMTALQHLMIHVPTPTLILSKLTEKGTARSFDVLKHGAIDFFSKEELNAQPVDGQVEAQLIDKTIHASKLKLEALEPVYSKFASPRKKGKRVKTLVFCEECGSRETLIIRENEDQGGVICRRCGEHISMEQRNKYRRANFVSLVIAGDGSYTNLLQFLPQLRQDINGAILVILDGPVDSITSFTKYMDAVSTIKVRRVHDNTVIQGGNCYIGGLREGIFLQPYSAEYTLKVRGEIERQGFVDTTIRSIANTFRHRTATIFLSGNKLYGASGLREVLAQKGHVIVLGSGRCLYAQLGRNIIDVFGARVIENEKDLATVVNDLHQRHRDSVVTA